MALSVVNGAARRLFAPSVYLFCQVAGSSALRVAGSKIFKVRSLVSEPGCGHLRVSTHWASVALLLLLCGSAGAQNTVAVETTGDDSEIGPCTMNSVPILCNTLRDAIAQVNQDSGDTLDLRNLRGTITIAPTDALVFFRPVTILGPGGNSLTIPGEFQFGSNASISGLTFSSGGGGIVGNVPGQSITITNSTFLSGSEVETTNSTTNVTNCSFMGGRLFAQAGPVTVTNSIFSGNYATNSGGVIHLFGGNSGEPAGTISESNNLFFNNTGGDASGFTLSSTDLTGMDPLLAPLGYYGGSTSTALLLPGSPAFCAGSASAVPSGTSTDQRGFPINASNCATGAIDLGSVQPNYIFVNTPSDTNDGSCGATCSLRDAISTYQCEPFRR